MNPPPFYYEKPSVWDKIDNWAWKALIATWAITTAATAANIAINAL